MKKLTIFICSAFCAVGAFGQGQITFANSSTTLITTNGSGGSGTTAVGANGFHYQLFTAPMVGFGAAQSSFSPLGSATWTVRANMSTNTAAVTGGRISGGGIQTLAAGAWDPGVTNSFAIVGWSANLGNSWADILPQLQSGNWVDPNGYFGQSGVGYGAAGGFNGVGTLPSFALFGAGPSSQGSPLTSGFVLTQVPEPSTFALAGLGAAALLAFRRRK